MNSPQVQHEAIERLVQNIIQASQLDLTYAIVAHPGSVPELTIELSGPDTSRVIARNAELLRAIEHLAFEVRRLEPEEHDLVSIDAGNYRRNRNLALRDLASRAARFVRETKRTYTFEPMSSHERRLLHLALAAEGLRSESTGDGPRRAVVLYPEGDSC